MAQKLSSDFLKDPKKKIIAGIFAVLMIALFYYNLFFKNQFAQIKKMSPQIQDLKRKIQAAERELLNLPIYKKQYEDMKDKIEICRKKLPYEKDIPNLLEHLSKTAKATGVKILAIEPVNPDVKIKQEAQEKGGLYLEMPIKIDARAGYHQLGIFINKLENSERFMKVTDLRIEKEGSNAKMHDVSLVISTFVLLQELKI